MTASSFWGRADHPHNLCPMGLRSAARQSRMPVLIYWATVRLAMTTAYGQRFGPQLADPSSVCWDFQAHHGQDSAVGPRTRQGKFKVQILWHTAVLVPILEPFLPISWIESGSQYSA